MDSETNSYSFTYSARQQKEINQIRSKYMDREDTAMERLKRLDKSAEKPGTVISVAVGATGTLLLGLGMTCTMVWTAYFVLGLALGLIGLAGMALALPLYQIVTQRERRRLAPEIMRLIEELDPQS